MSESQKKQMLYVHIRNMETNPHLYFEHEDYYENPRRLTYTQTALGTLDKEEFLSYEDEVERLGFYFLLRMMGKRRLCDNQGRQWAMAAYINEKDQSIDVDEEPFRANAQRQFCSFLPLKSVVRDDIIHDPVMCMRTGRMIVQNLL